MDRKVPPKFVAKPWGRDTLPWHLSAPSGVRVGEILFEPPPDFGRILVKYILTSAKLSVQVHPTGKQARARGLGVRGKDECWIVMEAEPGACLALGFEHSVRTKQLREAAIDGSIEDLMGWYPVYRGDFFYVPANTVHAIGAGLILLEVQQDTDLTYRLYDYDRSRELHLSQGLSIAKIQPYPDVLHQQVPTTGEIGLVHGPHFRVHCVNGIPSAEVVEQYSNGPLLALPLSGHIKLGENIIRVGECAAATDLGHIWFSPDAQCLLAQALGR